MAPRPPASVFFCAALIFASALSPTVAAGAEARGAAKIVEMTFAPDITALRASFAREGRLALPLPAAAELTIVGHETNVFAGDPVWYLIPEGGTRADAVVGGHFDILTLDGHVEGAEGSRASLLLAAEGIYGYAETADHIIEYDPMQVGDAFVQFVRIREKPASETVNARTAAVVGTSGQTASASSNSPVIIDNEATYRSLVSDWNNRAVAAFNQLRPDVARTERADLHSGSLRNPERADKR
jgi:hypothetical protein